MDNMATLQGGHRILYRDCVLALLVSLYRSHDLSGLTRDIDRTSHTDTLLKP